MNKKLILLFSIVIFIFIGVLLLLPRVKHQNQGKVQVVVSFYPIWEFTKAVAGEKAEVFNMTPPGSEPHDYEPTPTDISKIQTANLFIYNDAGLESWVSKVLDTVSEKKLLSLNLSNSIEVVPGDPHYWLDPNLAISEVKSIEAALSSVDPINKDYYKSNADKYISQLKALSDQFDVQLSRNCATRSVVSSHQALGYVGKRYGINIISISGLSPDEEPSPQKLSEIAQFAKKQNVHYIFFETLVSPRLSDTIAQEVGAKTLVFNPVEGLTDDEIARGKNYVSIQKENLSNLMVAMECK